MKKNSLFKNFAFFVLVVFIFFAGFFCGQDFKAKENLKEEPVKENLNLSKEAFDLSLFWEAVDILKKDFYKKENLKPKEMLYGAIKGMVKSLDDPYTEFFKPDEAQKFLEDIEGEFGGIGAEIGKEKGKLKIIAPLKDSPAEKAGLKPGDLILAINGSSTLDLSLSEAVKKIRGKIGTKVVLTILREGWEKPKDFEIVRALIKVPTLDLKFEKVDGKKIAILSLYTFNPNLSQAFYKKAFEIIFENPEGMILDLRNNTGGYLDVAIEIASWFLEKGKVIVKEVFPDGNENVFRSKREGIFSDFPLVVLVNQGTASAAEILAGALKDHQKAILVGEKTFGKGSVQQVRTLSDGSFLKVTVALWELPSGKIIEGKGLLPDFEVKNEEEKDLQLEKAKEVLLNEIEKREKIGLEDFLKKIKLEVIR